VSKTDPDEAGHYEMESHKIVMFDLAFKDSAVRFGNQASGAVSKASFDVAHEIGHAVDRRRVRAAQTTQDAANKALNDKFGKFKTKSGDFKLEKVPADVLKEFNDALKASKDAEKTVDATVTDSGERFQGSDLKDDPKKNTDFKKAATAAGGVRITPYSEKLWREFFAESFALYNIDPETLKRLRPKLSEYFEKNFPKKKP
jgi:hypothetical protein